MKKICIKPSEDYKYIDDDGNVISDGYQKMAFYDEDDNQISNEYQYIEPLLNIKNHYIVVDLIPLKFDDEGYVFSKYKYGVISLSYDSKGNVLPFKEKLIVPMIYDSIQEDSKNMISVTNDDRITYIELNNNSKNYGKQLVPCILSYALPFDHTYKGFAYCSIDGKKHGYIKRDYNLDVLTNRDLLTRSEVKKLTDGGVKKLVKRKK